MKPIYSVGLVVAGLLYDSGAAVAQGIPCFSAAQCAQIRQQAEQQQAAQRDAQTAAIEGAARAQRERARSIVQARVQAEAEAQTAAVARARQTQQDQAAYEEQRARQARYQADADARAQAARVQERLAFEEQRARQAQAQADAEARAQEARVEAQQVAERRAAAQFAAENSSDNRCRDQKTAGAMLDYFNGLKGAADYAGRAVDIDHLTTLQYDPARSIVRCHGSFILGNGRRETGTLSTRLNVAGNILSIFNADTE